MKKILFPAVLAIVAVGGAAFSVKAQTYYLNSPTGFAFICQGIGSTCIMTIGASNVYDAAGNLVTKT
jgi:hypothetical protein